MNIGIYIYNDAEVLDFSGPFEVFSTASRICENDTPFSPFLISENGKTVIEEGGTALTHLIVFMIHPK